MRQRASGDCVVLMSKVQAVLVSGHRCVSQRLPLTRGASKLGCRARTWQPPAAPSLPYPHPFFIDRPILVPQPDRFSEAFFPTLALPSRFTPSPQIQAPCFYKAILVSSEAWATATILGFSPCHRYFTFTVTAASRKRAGLHTRRVDCARMAVSPLAQSGST